MLVTDVPSCGGFFTVCRDDQDDGSSDGNVEFSQRIVPFYNIVSLLTFMVSII